MTLQPPDLENIVDIVDIRRFQAEPLFDPWAEVVVPDFPISTLPTTVARFVCSQSELIGCDPAGLAMACITALGAALDHRFSMRIMRNGAWKASPRLWTLLSGDPSRKKTPSINAATHELETAQGEAFEAWESECARLKADGIDEGEWPPRPARYVVADTTAEKLGEILGRQARGILSKRDELAGWIGQMDRYGGRGQGAADRAMWLQAFDGGRFTVDRIGRGEKHVANLSVSVLGGIQPAKLAEMRDQTSDGLLQRFIPVILKAASFPVDAPAGDAPHAYGRLVRRLLKLEPANLAMDDEAMVEMAALRRHIFDLEQASGGFAPGFQAFLGKLPGMAASTALILHLAADTVHGRTTPVGLQTVLAVRHITEAFILPHAFEFYRSAETTTEGDRIQRIASWIVTSRKDRVRTTDLASNVSICKGAGPSAIAEMVGPLVAAGWLTPDGKGDPIAKAWSVEPAVQKQFAERRRTEERRKDALASLMKSPRRPGKSEPDGGSDR